MKKLYVVRHGQTEFNVQKRCQGWKDSPLTPKGIQQAQRVRDYFKENHIHFDRAFSSDLQRAIDTMQIIVDPSVPRFKSPGLREMSFGKYDGWKHTEIPASSDPEFYKKNGGESADEAIKRVFLTMYRIVQESDDRSLLFVTHGIPVAGLFKILPHRDGVPEAEDFPNGCILEIEVDGDDWTITDFIQTEKEAFHL